MNVSAKFKLSLRSTGKTAPLLFIITCLLLSFSACAELQRPASEPYFAEAKPPVRQEFRWSNGKLPTTIDPAKAASSPETDLVRAVFEGLTELDPATLTEVPAAAESWTSSDDLRTWTFVLRKDARWSDGRPVIPDDFIRSWRRAAESRENVPHRPLLSNIVGMADLEPRTEGGATDEPAVAEPTVSSIINTAKVKLGPRGQNPASATPSDTPPDESDASPAEAPEIGVKAADPRTLVVTLIHPDRHLPRLLAHPIFRPVPEGVDDLTPASASMSVSNGAFRVAAAGEEGVTLERSDTYWNRAAVKLERVLVIPAENPEQVLEAYRNGELDAVTNVQFSPLVLKLLSPYEDFRRTSYSAVNILQLNPDSPALRDRRVRQALSMAIDRERLAEGELEGTTRPALAFTPFSSEARKELQQDKEKARDLLEEAGYPDGIGFPLLRLVVNRNDTQQRVARRIAAMWNDTLNIGTEIVVRETNEIENIRQSGDFDVLRRGVVLATSSEFVNMRAIFGKLAERQTVVSEEDGMKFADRPNGNRTARNESEGSSSRDRPAPIVSESDALFELTAIPLYFPISFSLVKPYIDGFVSNSLDAPLLQGVSIKENWQPNTAGPES
jgi:oligopeptide transport system substrate-binding protein